MKLYKVHMDLSMILSRVKAYDLGVYSSAHPIVFVEARNPDDACFKAMGGLLFKIMQQDKENKNKTKVLCQDISHDIRISKAYIP